MISETHDGRLYTAILTNGIVRVFGPGISGAAEYYGNGESDLSDAIRFTVERIVNAPRYVYKARERYDFSGNVEYHLLNSLGDHVSTMNVSRAAMLDYADQQSLTAISAAQRRTLTNG